MQYKSVFVSDVHLATRFSKAELLLDFLEQNSFDAIYLVGDIIDGWVMKRKFLWTSSQAKVVEKILNLAKSGTKVYYFAGNHDHFLRRFLPMTICENLHILDKMDYEAINGKRYVIMHGDQFDSVSTDQQWLAEWGDWWYNLLLATNIPINYVRQKVLGRQEYWSFSRAAKNFFKGYANKKTNYKELLIDYVKDNNYDGIIFGHIHKVEISVLEDFDYINCGDWVESCSAIVENLDGTWDIKQLSY